MPVDHHGDPPQLFKAGIPVVLEGHFARAARVASDQIMVKHTASYVGQHPDRLKTPSTVPTPAVGAREPVNAAIGQSAVLLGLLASVAGIVTLAIGLVRGRTDLLRAGRTYTWLILAGAVVAAGGHGARPITHDFSLQYVADNDSRGHAAAVHDHRPCGRPWQGSILLWALILAGYLAVDGVQVPRAGSTDPLVGWATLDRSTWWRRSSSG